MTTEPFAPIPIVTDEQPRRRWWVVPLAVAGGVLLVAAGVFVILVESPRPLAPAGKSALRAAAESCGNVGELADGDRTLVLDMAGSDVGSGTLNRTDVMCVLAALRTPTYVTTAMGQTRALDGRQSQTWDGFEASWTYHPDDGLDVLIREH